MEILTEELLDFWEGVTLYARLSPSLQIPPALSRFPLKLNLLSPASQRR